jgi:hypothetical protein
VAVPGVATPVAIRWLMPRTMMADGTAAVMDAVSGIHLFAQYMTSAVSQGTCHVFATTTRGWNHERESGPTRVGSRVISPTTG